MDRSDQMIQSDTHCDSFYSSSVAQQMNDVPFVQLRNFAKKLGLEIAFGSTKPQLIRQIVEATGFRTGDRIEVVREFSTDCDVPHLLTVGTRLIIDDVDDDGDLAVNLLCNPWDENAWIMKENFDCIKIAEKQAFITRDDEVENALPVVVGHAKADDKIQRFLTIKKKSVWRVSGGNTFKSQEDGRIEEILMNIFEDVIISATITDFVYGKRVLPTKTKMFEAIRIGLQKLCGDAIEWSSFCWHVSHFNSFFWKLLDLQQVIYYIWIPDSMDLLLGSLPLSDNAKCTGYHAFAINKMMVRSIGSCSCVGAFGSELRFSDMKGPKRTSFDSERCYVTKCKIFRSNIKYIKWTEDELNMLAF